MQRGSSISHIIIQSIARYFLLFIFSFPYFFLSIFGLWLESKCHRDSSAIKSLLCRITCVILVNLFLKMGYIFTFSNLKMIINHMWEIQGHSDGKWQGRDLAGWNKWNNVKNEQRAQKLVLQQVCISIV